ncbi:MAG: VCBS repeat-containing protein [Spirochaetales bacterium]|nr:VCBS repeat-containing protein [Spirochaetales bacterium]
MKLSRIIAFILAASFLISCENLLTKAQEVNASRAVLTPGCIADYNLGKGYDIRNSSTKELAFDLDTLKAISKDPELDDGTTMKMYTVINDTSELTKIDKNIDIDVDVNISQLNLNLNSHYSLIKDAKISNNSVSMFVVVKYLDEVFDVEKARLSQEAIDYKNNNGVKAFIDRYGDVYLDKVSIGGTMIFEYKLKTSNSKEISKEKMGAALRIKYKELFDSNASLGTVQVSENELSQMSSEIYYTVNGKMAMDVEINSHEDFKKLKAQFISNINSGDKSVVSSSYLKYTNLGMNLGLYYSAINTCEYFKSILNSTINVAYKQFEKGNYEASLILDKAKAKLAEISNIEDSFELTSETFSIPSYSEFIEYIEYQKSVNEPVDIFAPPLHQFYINDDVNRDGYPDIISNSLTNSNVTTILISKPTGGYHLPITYTAPITGWRGYLFEKGDVNGDGRTDLIWNLPEKTNRVYTAISLGDGNFDFKDLWVPSVEGWKGYKFAVGHVNNDKKIDLIWNSADHTNRTYIATYDDDGIYNLSRHWDIPFTGWRGYKFKAGDVNGDGLTDLVWNVTTDYNRTYVSFCNGNGTFAYPIKHQRSETGWNGFHFDLRYIDSDNKIDLLWTHPDGTPTYYSLSKGNGSFIDLKGAIN